MLTGLGVHTVASFDENAIHSSMLFFRFDNLTSQADLQEAVFLSTLHSLKGLEFNAVILADVNHRTASLIQKSEELNAVDKE